MSKKDEHENELIINEYKKDTYTTEFTENERAQNICHYWKTMAIWFERQYLISKFVEKCVQADGFHFEESFK